MSIEDLDLSLVPLKPLGRREIQQLEAALIIGTVFRPEVIELIKDPTERATWLDSLAVAAAAIARERAGMTASTIADEIGRSEASVRSHITGKTKAGKLIKETLELLSKGELKLITVSSRGELENLKKENEKLTAELNSLRSKVKNMEETITEKNKTIEKLEFKLKSLSEALEKVLSIINEALRLSQT